MENIEKYKEFLLTKNLSSRTISLYESMLMNTANKLSMNLDDITEVHLKRIVTAKGERKISPSSQSVIINAFKSYFKIIQGRKFDHDILPRPKIYQKQPDILSLDEIQRMIKNTHNLKHKAIISLMYSCALRVSELVSLKIKDIDSNNKKINVRQAKGKIDRVVMLDEGILGLLREYWSAYHTSFYLFEGAKGGVYSVTSVQNIVKKAAKKCQINKKISSHSLRHSCLTQLIKNGVDLRRVQKIAGHKNINTTAGYIKIIDEDVINTESPIKGIDLSRPLFN